MEPTLVAALIVPCCIALAGVATWGLWRAVSVRSEAKWRARFEQERATGAHLCLSTVESLAAALDAADPYNNGSLEFVLSIVTAFSRRMTLSASDCSALHAAALLHNVGRLGVPDHLLHKAEALTSDEQEKLRSHPVLGARILASIPFPWPVVPIVRHQMEHWDGTGYPDGLRGDDIPLGARILAIATSYSSMLRRRAFRPPLSPATAIIEIVNRSGSEFDPNIVGLFLDVIGEMSVQGEEEPIRIDIKEFQPAIDGADFKHAAALEARSALEDIAAAQRETLALYALSQAVTGSLHLEELCDTIVQSALSIVPCAACVIFLPEQDQEYLRAHAAIGMNSRHLLGSLARIGAYLTGRAYFRGEIARASFLSDDLILRDVSDVWQPFRSTLVVPLMANGTVTGTLNLYAESPDGFDADAQRAMRLLATQAGRAVDGALRYDAVRETAYTDALTGLRNARYLREYLERELNRASRDGTAVAVLNIDLDNFKPINDRFGHARGDQILQEVAEIFRSHVRNYDLAARYAGDEFVLVLVRSKRSAADAFAAKIKAAVERHGQRLVAREPEFPQIGISIGVAVYPESGTDMQSLLCNSDAAMYSDKIARKADRPAA